MPQKGIGTLDQKDANGDKVYGREMAMALAISHPERACINSENFDQFFQYIYALQHGPGIRQTGIDGWKGGLPRHLDAAINHPNGNVYFFKDDQYFRFDVARDSVDKGPSEIGRGGWKNLPTHLDAAVLHPNGLGYFFKGEKYYRYDFAKDECGSARMIGQTGWAGLRGGIDAAIVHPTNGKAYFFYGTTVIPFNFTTDQAETPQFITDSAYGALYGHIDAAVVHPKNKVSYFFFDRYYHRIA